MDNVVEKLKAWRKSQKPPVSQSEVARLLSVSESTVRSWEQGKREPGYENTISIEELISSDQNGAIHTRLLVKGEEALASSLIPSRVEEYERQLQTIREMLDDLIREGVHYEKSDTGGKRLLPQGARKLLAALGMTTIEARIDFDPTIDGGYVVVLWGSLRRVGSDEDIARSTGVSSTSEFDPAEGTDLMSVASTVCFRRASDRLLIKLLLSGTAAGEVFEP